MALSTMAVLGAGSWGTALAILLSRSGRPARLWAHRPEQASAMGEARCNRRYLPDAPFPSSLEVHDSLDAVLDGADAVLVAVPSHAFRATLEAVVRRVAPDLPLCWATKGLEPGSNRLLHEVAEDVAGAERPLGVISGPTFAREVAAGLPTAVTVAAPDSRFATALAERLHDDRFRAYTGTDVVGVELGGAVKNVLAIAAGIADGLGFGANTRAALITRGLAEMMRLGVAAGGRQQTFMGLAGMGDLVLTCTDDQSRNRRLGLALGRGLGIDEALAGIDQVVEGMQTAREIHRLASARGVEMPISEQVYRVLYEGHRPQLAVTELLEREQKPEA